MTSIYRVEHKLPRTPKDDIICKEERERVMIADALVAVKELRSYPLNSHEEECLDIIEEALRKGSSKDGG